MRSPEAVLPMDWWQIDLVAMPTSTHGYSYILTIIDLFTSFVLTRPLKTKSQEEVAANLVQILADWGPPRILQSDAGNEFVNSVLAELARVHKITLKVSTPYYKHSTGSVERVHYTIGSSLKKMLEGALAHWDVYSPIVTHFYNTTTRSLTNSTPYALMFARGCNPLHVGGDDTDSAVSDTHSLDDTEVLADFDLESWLEDNDFGSWITKHHERLTESQKRVLSTFYPSIKESIAKRRKVSSSRFNKTHRIVPPLRVGTMVMCKDEEKKSKHDQHWVGPYRIKEVIETGTYILVNDLGDELHRAVSQLKVLPNELEEESPDFETVECEKIITHRGSGRTLQYLIKWRDLPHSDNSWVKPKDFHDVRIISDYWAKRAPPRATKRSRKPSRKVVESL